MVVPFWTFLVPPLWIASIFAASVWHRRKKGKPISPRIPADARYGEKGCSGRSLKGILSRIGGASNCLLVFVQGNRLVITPQFPFNLMFLPEVYGLDVDLPLEMVKTIAPAATLFRKVLRIEFASGGPAPIELVLHDEKGFIQAIGQHVLVQGGRELRVPQGLKKLRGFKWFRIFLAIWGAGGLFAAVTGLRDDWQYRQDGVPAIATYVNPDQEIDHQAKMGILTYSVAGTDYRLNSINGVGLYTAGEKEQIYYLPANPQDARQEDYFRFDLLFLALGSIALSISVFGGIISRRIW